MDIPPSTRSLGWTCSSDSRTEAGGSSATSPIRQHPDNRCDNSTFHWQSLAESANNGNLGDESDGQGSMIHYDLRCSEDHTFDGWFKDSAAFERLAKRGMLECPHCGGT